MATKKKITIENLAQMVQGGFSELKSEIKDGLKELRTEMNEKFDQVDVRFDHIENLILRDHDNRITKAEDDIRILKTAVGK